MSNDRPLALLDSQADSSKDADATLPLDSPTEKYDNTIAYNDEE